MDKGGSACRHGTPPSPERRSGFSLDKPPRQNPKGAVQPVPASAPWAVASQALNAQGEPWRDHGQPGNETNSEAH